MYIYIVLARDNKYHNTMRLLDKYEIRNIQQNILQEFRAICERENLKYSLYAGTLIGALRHKGFIPWDDDIDVALPRDDYEKFLKVFNDTHHPSYLRLCDSRITSGYDYPFMKLEDTRTVCKGMGKETQCPELGIHIDIFAIDGMPKCQSLALLHCKMMTFLRHCCEMSRLSLGVKERAFSKRCLIAAFKICTLGAPMSFWHRLSNFLGSLFDMKKSRWSGNVVWGYGVREMVPTECYEKRTKVSFEGEEYDAFSDYDTYLRTVYGDYMTPPPPEKRIGIHVVEAYMK